MRHNIILLCLSLRLMSRDKLFRDVSVQEAGRRGGLMVLTTYGREHFSKIGRQGQKALRDQYPGMASIWGKQGGRPRKPNIDDMGGLDVNKRRGGCGSAYKQTSVPKKFSSRYFPEFLIFFFSHNIL